MSKSQRRAKAEKRTARRRPALCWHDVLKQFAEWLVRSGCTTDPLAAYSTAMAVDRSSREHDIVVAGSDIPLELFDTDLFADDCGHTPWSPYDTVDALGLFAKFVVEERVSPTQTDDFAEIVGVSPPRVASVPSRCSAPLGPTTLTSHVRRVAAWCEDNGSVPEPCFAHPRSSRQLREALGPTGDSNTLSELLSTVTYQVVIATAVGVGALCNKDRTIRAGDAFDHWLSAPSEEWRRRSLVEAYIACLEPVVAPDGASLQSEMTAACAALWFILVRSLVDDPAHDGEAFDTGIDTDVDKVSAWVSVRLVTMVDLGLIVPVNGQLCVPDSHASALLEALDGGRLNTSTSADVEGRS
ncbi:hypothetical protein HQ305_16940 [Rhodococcus sp. BP-149]|uniref:hypothetical protein n=1 Tax=unclassified Rhodococcus (in: high G+C Gram-positive bacteria) TaxID=192944 RepID=UPI001C9B85BB|nr:MULTISPECIES: hypothetical protein [unclassified Rhodococcus (in: high G+C Gram-positive bacteria)]MBY6687247.1 hypothetical protein [Rhodococcus sp. BP-288]MBY6694330.1 hypothetical protein [Rhodococcus sp. BP-188]MBY6698039.1 hypothetical protein [Rhodococcus sp. BP-285]MBY6704259.1 hypothetical protein [Rhodococcus sp. BP-283]MBY6712908.1 hypothetical protein [Rhodococcus sp. BP-160]